MKNVWSCPLAVSVLLYLRSVCRSGRARRRRWRRPGRRRVGSRRCTTCIRRGSRRARCHRRSRWRRAPARACWRPRRCRPRPPRRAGWSPGRTRRCTAPGRRGPGAVLGVHACLGDDRQPSHLPTSAGVAAAGTAPARRPAGGTMDHPDQRQQPGRFSGGAAPRQGPAPAFDDLACHDEGRVPAAVHERRGAEVDVHVRPGRGNTGLEAALPRRHVEITADRHDVRRRDGIHAAVETTTVD